MIVLSPLLIVPDKVIDPLTTSAKIAKRTKTYSSMSCPASSPWNFLMSSLNLIVALLLSRFFRHTRSVPQMPSHGDQTLEIVRPSK